MCPPHVCRASRWARSGSPPPAWTGAASPACSPRASHATSSCARSTSASLWALGSSRWTQRAPRRAAAPATSPPVCRASGAVAPASAFSCGASRSSRRRAGPCSARCTHPEHSTPTPPCNLPTLAPFPTPHLDAGQQVGGSLTGPRALYHCTAPQRQRLSRGGAARRAGRVDCTRLCAACHYPTAAGYLRRRRRLATRRGRVLRPKTWQGASGGARTHMYLNLTVTGVTDRVCLCRLSRVCKLSSTTVRSSIFTAPLPATRAAGVLRNRRGQSNNRTTCAFP